MYYVSPFNSVVLYPTLLINTEARPCTKMSIFRLRLLAIKCLQRKQEFRWKQFALGKSMLHNRENNIIMFNWRLWIFFQVSLAYRRFGLNFLSLVNDLHKSTSTFHITLMSMNVFCWLATLTPRVTASSA